MIINTKRRITLSENDPQNKIITKLSWLKPKQLETSKRQCI